jgi:hypothetical protein
VNTEWRRDLSPLRLEDAPALRRFAMSLERKDSRETWWARFLGDVIARVVRAAADQIDAGELRGRP